MAGLEAAGSAGAALDRFPLENATAGWQDYKKGVMSLPLSTRHSSRVGGGPRAAKPLLRCGVHLVEERFCGSEAPIANAGKIARVGWVLCVAFEIMLDAGE